MRFWDTSAIVPLLVHESTTGALVELYRSDPEMLVWWATPVECVSAVTRIAREGAMREEAVGPTLERLTALADTWTVIEPTERVRQIAIRLLRVHPLRAADAMQLAAATVGSEDARGSLSFVTRHEQLATAADREGFVVIRAERASSA